MSEFTKMIIDGNPTGCLWATRLVAEAGDVGMLVLMNFHEESRIPSDRWATFATSTLDDFRRSNEAVASYRRAIINADLLRILSATDSGIPLDGVHFASRSYLNRAGYTDIPMDEDPPRVITLKRPLGSTKRLLWVTFKVHLDLTEFDSVEIRNVLGLVVGPGDFLYRFPVSLTRRKYVPSVFDAFGEPPFRPATAGSSWGTTINLVDNSPGLPELLIDPLTDIAESPTGYLVEPMIYSPPSMAYIRVRLEEFRNDRDYLNRSPSCSL